MDFFKTKVKNFSVNKQIEEKIPENDEIFFGLVEDYKNCEKEWRKNNPNGKKAQCIRDTGLSKMTVYKWWNQ